MVEAALYFQSGRPISDILVRQVLDDLDEHFSCNVRELGLKAVIIKEKLTELLNKSHAGAAPMES